MAAREGKINTSVGIPGEPEARPFSRLYQTLLSPVNTLEELSSSFAKLEGNSSGYRRLVHRSLCSNTALTQALQSHLPIEAVIPIAGHDSSIVFLGKNSHDSPPQGLDVKKLISERRNGKKPVEKVQRAIENGFLLLNRLGENDVQDLLNLWERFGWTEEEIVNFIQRIQTQENDLWFSAIRNPEGKLVAACTAEEINFAGINYIETTEYSTLDGFEGQGLCTAAVSGLIAQILSTIKKEEVTVITAEFNTSSTSAAIGASVGFVIPKTEGVSQILSYNVAVTDDSPPNPVFADSIEEDRGIPLGFLRDFAVGVLPLENIVNFYPPDHIDQIISLYN